MAHLAVLFSFPQIRPSSKRPVRPVPSTSPSRSINLPGNSCSSLSRWTSTPHPPAEKQRRRRRRTRKRKRNRRREIHLNHARPHPPLRQTSRTHPRPQAHGRKAQQACGHHPAKTGSDDPDHPHPRATCSHRGGHGSSLPRSWMGGCMRGGRWMG